MAQLAPPIRHRVYRPRVPRPPPLIRPAVPDCYDDPRLFLYDWMADACRDCTVEYQREMIVARRCHPPEWDVTPIGRRDQTEVDEDE